MSSNKSNRIRPTFSEYLTAWFYGPFVSSARTQAKLRRAEEEKNAALAEERERIAAMEALEAQQREAERQQMLCPTCGGSGQSMAGALCPFCGGSGTRRVELCPICGGQGVNAAGSPCPYCGGRGQYFVN